MLLGHGLRAKTLAPKANARWDWAWTAGPAAPRPLPPMHRRRLRPDPRLADWLDLLDELEPGGPLMREVVRDSLEAIARAPAGKE